MKNHAETKEKVKKEYIEKFAKVSELSTKHKVCRKTIYRWKYADRWDDKLKDLAKVMYLEERQKLAAIAQKMRRSTNEIKAWKEKGKWDRDILLGGNIGLSREVHKEFMDQVRKAVKEKTLSEPGTVDTLSKLMKVVERLNPERIQLSNIFQLLRDLTGFVIKYGDDDFAKKFQSLLPDMADHLREKYAG